MMKVKTSKLIFICLILYFLIDSQGIFTFFVPTHNSLNVIFLYELRNDMNKISHSSDVRAKIAILPNKYESSYPNPIAEIIISNNPISAKLIGIALLRITNCLCAIKLYSILSPPHRAIKTNLLSGKL